MNHSAHAQLPTSGSIKYIIGLYIIQAWVVLGMVLPEQSSLPMVIGPAIHGTIDLAGFSTTQQSAAIHSRLRSIQLCDTNSEAETSKISKFTHPKIAGRHNTNTVSMQQ